MRYNMYKNPIILTYLLQDVGSDHREGGPFYMVNMESIVAALRRKTIYNIAKARFGDVSGRIVELLQRWVVVFCFV